MELYLSLEAQSNYFNKDKKMINLKWARQSSKHFTESLCSVLITILMVGVIISGETEAHNDYVTCLRSERLKVMRQGFESRYSDSRTPIKK